MGFFDQTPPPQPVQRPERPIWAGPPPGVLPGLSDQRAVLARTEDVLMCIDGFRVYPNGLEFAMTVQLRDTSSQDERALSVLHGPPMGELTDDFVRFGIQFADGTKWTNLDTHPMSVVTDEGSFAGPVVLSQGGGGGDGQWRLRFWTWPLPPGPTMTFVVSWPSEGIDETTVEIDTDVIHRAGNDAEVLWH